MIHLSSKDSDINSENNKVNDPINDRYHHRPLALTSPKQRQGSRFEQLARVYLQQQGLVLIAQNWQQPKVGELDLVMLQTGQAWSTLVFIEVRQRQRSSFGDAALSVTVSKQRKIIKTAKYFLQHYREYRDYECRFDVIAYDIKGFTDLQTDYEPEWLQSAFIAPAW